jgi:hypothetical protein
MGEKVRGHIRSNVVGYVALFFSLGLGTAWASHETIFSSDIVDGEVRSADVRNDSLSGGGLAAADLRAGSVQSSEVLNDSLTGADIDESTLGRPIYAKIDPDGVVQNDDGQSEGIEPSMVYKPIDPQTGSTAVGVYCFKDLPFHAKTGMAISHGFPPDIVASMLVATSGWPTGCSAGDEAKVSLRTTNGTPIDAHFTVWFTD